MKIKKYIADSMPEAMDVIRKDLGTDAVILQTKQIKQKRFLGLFHKKKIEVIAAKDPHPYQTKKEGTAGNAGPAEKAKPLVQTGQTAEHEILQEIKSLKKIIELETSNKELDLPPDYKIAHHALLMQEVDRSLADEIIADAFAKLESEKEPGRKRIQQTVKGLINDRLNKLTFDGITNEDKIVQFVGPTGVGKTTTIAKIAAQLMLKEKKRVAFITTDTYRIAAIEQLKTYARILNVPLEVAYNVDDYHQAIEKLADHDVILVDTAGRNFRNPTYIDQLKEMMGNVTGISTYLVLALTAKPKDMVGLFEQFKQIPLKEVIFTKMDETSQYGSILSITLPNEIGIAYMTNGQDVPDDLVKPNPSLISELIVGDLHD